MQRELRPAWLLHAQHMGALPWLPSTSQWKQPWNLGPLEKEAGILLEGASQLVPGPPCLSWEPPATQANGLLARLVGGV